MEKWQFNTLFVIACGASVFIFLAPIIPGMSGVLKNPAAVGPVGLILTYVLTQRSSIVKKNGKKEKEDDS